MAEPALEGANIPPPRAKSHYHGHATRAIFVSIAIILIIAESTRANLPVTITGAVLSAIVMVVAAGITNPKIGWIHWANAVIAVWGAVLFGTSAVTHYRAGSGIFDTNFIYIEALALLFLAAIYFTTRTIRGILLHQNLSENGW